MFEDKPAMPGHIEGSIEFYHPSYIKQYQYNLESKRPSKLYDPESKLEVTADQDSGQMRRLTVQNRSPILLGLTDEKGRLSWRDTPMLHYSSYRDWQAMAKAFLPGYEAVARQIPAGLLPS